MEEVSSQLFFLTELQETLFLFSNKVTRRLRPCLHGVGDPGLVG